MSRMYALSKEMTEMMSYQYLPLWRGEGGEDLIKQIVIVHFEKVKKSYSASKSKHNNFQLISNNTFCILPIQNEIPTFEWYS